MIEQRIHPQTHVLTFLVPLTPVPCARPRFSKHGTYSPQSNVRFTNDFRTLAREHLPKLPWEGPLNLSLVFQIPKPPSVKRDLPHVKPDIDNFIKSVLDAMNPELGWTGFWIDDAQVVKLEARKRYGKIPFVWVQIERAGEGDTP